jgi:hypothetical protein
MKPIVSTVFLLALILPACSPAQPKLVPEAPHGGTLFPMPDQPGRVEVIREDDPASPEKVRIIAYVLNEEFQPITPAPTAVSFQPKDPRNAPTIELKPVVDADPAKASGLASPPFANAGSVAGQLAVTLGGRRIQVPNKHR